MGVAEPKIYHKLTSEAEKSVLDFKTIPSFPPVWSVLDCLLLLLLFYFQIAHSVHVDSPLGPDAFHEYETLLVQDYEELLKKSEKKRLQQEREAEKLTGSIYEKNLASEDDSWRKLPSGENDQTVYADNSINSTGRVEFSAKLFVSVDHFPMIFCPLSPQVFILPSEGTVAEACLSADSENSVSPGLPSLSTGSSSDGDDVPPGATLTANFLYHLVEKVDFLSLICL